jgi:hypothetical protein
MDAATADPKANVANGKETREFLGQSVGFENELISQSKFPHQPSPRCPIAAGQSFLTGRFSRASWNSPREAAASTAEYAANGPPYARRKGWYCCKRPSFHFAISRMARGQEDWIGQLAAGQLFEATVRSGKKSLTVFRCNLRPSLKISA